MGIAQAFDTTGYYVEAIDLLANNVLSESGIALIIAIYSALRKMPGLPELLVLGDLTIQGHIRGVRSFASGVDRCRRMALLGAPCKEHRHA
jgi:ATP-dependent Lon protease